MQQLFLVHTPKCGGKSLREGLQKAYGDALHLEYSNPLKANWLRKVKQAIKPPKRDVPQGKRVVYGHYSFDRFRGVVQVPGVARGMFFRDPMTLMCSYYFYQKEKHPEQVKHGFVEFVSRPVHKRFYATFLGDSRIHELDFVGIFEDYQRSLTLFDRTFQVELEEFRINQTKVRPTNYHDFLDDNGYREPLAKAMEENTGLYDQAKSRFHELCSALAI